MSILAVCGWIMTIFFAIISAYWRGRRDGILWTQKLYQQAREEVEEIDSITKRR